MNFKIVPFEGIRQKLRKSSETRVREKNFKVSNVSDSQSSQPVDDSIPLNEGRRLAIEEQFRIERKKRMIKVSLASIVLLGVVCFAYYFFFIDGYHWTSFR